METLKRKRGKLKVLVVLQEGYDLLATYGAYEVLIACPQRFHVSVAGATPFVSTPGGPPCAVDVRFGGGGGGGEGELVAIPPADVLLVPDGGSPESTDAAAAGALGSFLAECARENPDAIVARVGPGATASSSTGPSSELLALGPLRGLPPERCELLRSASGADLAVHLVEELAGTKARVAAEEMVEYRGGDPFATVPPPPITPKDAFRTANDEAKSIRLGVFLFEGFEMLDTFGPIAAFVAANEIYAEQNPERKDEPLFKITYYAERSLVQSSRGPVFKVDQLLDEPPKLDWLLIPGGIGSLTERYNPVGQNWTRLAAEEAERVLTVCSGSGYLADLGLLDGRKATTNKLAFDLVESWAPAVRWQPTPRWVRDGKYWTSSGVAAGTDQALAVLEADFGVAGLADACAHRMGWHRRVANGDRDCFVARRAWRLETIVINLLMRVLCSWLPPSWRPSAITLGEYFG